MVQISVETKPTSYSFCTTGQGKSKRLLKRVSKSSHNKSNYIVCLEGKYKITIHHLRPPEHWRNLVPSLVWHCICTRIEFHSQSLLPPPSPLAQPSFFVWYYVIQGQNPTHNHFSLEFGSPLELLEINPTVQMRIKSLLFRQNKRGSKFLFLLPFSIPPFPPTKKKSTN